jgi:DNA-directed RNA polymerase specialized sigma24 family protein
LDLRLVGLSDTLLSGLRDVEYLDRNAYILTELRGLTTYEAAHVLGIDQSTVSRRADRARRHLKEMIA